MNLADLLDILFWPIAVIVVSLTIGTVARVYGALALRRIAPGVAVPWDAEGPQRDCLVRILDLGTSDKQWAHVEYDHRGIYEIVDSGRRLHELRPGVIVTHYAELPEVRP